jgi:hypothetical protein
MECQYYYSTDMRGLLVDTMAAPVAVLYVKAHSDVTACSWLWLCRIGLDFSAALQLAMY